MSRRVARRLAGLLAAGLCALLAGGCTSILTKTVVETVTGPAGCQALVVPSPGTGPTVHEGTCETEGVTFQIVNVGELLSLDELNLRVLGVRVGQRLRAAGKTLYASGSYIVITVRIGNTWDLPARFDGGGVREAALQGHEIRFTEALYSESHVPTSCLEMNDRAIRPGNSETCQIIFDVPGSAIPRMRTHGAGLLVTDFGTDVTSADVMLEGIVYVRLPRRNERIDLDG